MVIEPGNGINTHSSTAGKARSQAPSKAEGPPAGNVKSNTPVSSDSVSLSSTSLAMAKVEANVLESSDINESKVAEIKAAIDSGSYEIDSQAIANKIQSEESLLG